MGRPLLLTGQKDEIASAMPAGLGRLLEQSGFQPGAGMASQDRPASDASRSSYDAPRSAPLRVADDTPATSRGASWAYWVLPLLALGGLLWFLFPREDGTGDRCA